MKAGTLEASEEQTFQKQHQPGTGNSVISFLTVRNFLPLSNLLGIIRSQSEGEVGNRLEMNPNFRKKLKGGES